MYMSEIELKRRTDIHWARKIWHLGGVLFIVIIYENVSRSTAIPLITFFSLLFIVNDILRQQIPALNRAMIACFHPLMREHERNALAGTSYLLLGCFIIMVLFPKAIVTLSLLFLAVADPMASYIGILYGRDKLLGNKSLQGTAAAFVVCAVISAVYFFIHGLMLERLLIVCCLSGFIGALSELIPIGRLDDNLSFPLLSSSLLWLLFYVFGGA